MAILDDSDLEQEVPVEPAMMRRSSTNIKAVAHATSAPLSKPSETFREAVMSSIVELREALHLNFFATTALSLPRFEAKFLRFERRHHQRDKKRRPESLLAASFVVNGSCWYPSSSLPPSLVAAFFPRSLVVPSPEGDTRYHESKAQARLCCFVSACLFDESLFAKAIMSKRFRDSRRPIAVLHDPTPACSEKFRPPFAAMVRESSGSCYFSFVDRCGDAIGPRVEL